jgi:hypothetical protein
MLAVEEGVKRPSRSSVLRDALLLAAALAIGEVPATPLPPAPESIRQMRGFPVVLEPPAPGESLSAHWNYHGVVLADLDDADGLEIVYSSSECLMPSCPTGRIHAWTARGQLLPGFPVATIGGAYHAPSVDDLDGDGDQEIVQITTDSNSMARLYVVDHLGNVLDGYPLVVGGAEHGDGGSLYDLDRDGALEIVYASSTGIHVFESDGTHWSGHWPVAMRAGAFKITPALGDLDGDGWAEVFVAQGPRLHLLRADGSEMEGWPKENLGGSAGPLSSPAIADLDGDGDREVVVPLEIGEELSTTVIQVYAFHHNGAVVKGWPRPVGEDLSQCQPLITDLEDDGELEVVIGGSVQWASAIHAFDAAGNPKPGFPYISDQPSGRVSLVTAADTNGDGFMEIFSDAGSDDVTGRGYVLGIDHTGSTLPGFPLRPRGITDLNGAIIADVDGDGDCELGAVSMSLSYPDWTVYVNLYDLPGVCVASERDWPTFHAANRRGGLYRKVFRGWPVVLAEDDQNPSE